MNYYQQNKEKESLRLKKWYQENKERIKKRVREYSEANKEKLKEKITCDCGGKYTYENKSHHFKSQKHQKYII